MKKLITFILTCLTLVLIGGHSAHADISYTNTTGCKSGYYNIGSVVINGDTVSLCAQEGHGAQHLESLTAVANQYEKTGTLPSPDCSNTYFTAVPQPVPATPQNVTASTGGMCGGVINLHWSPAARASSYMIRRYTSRTDAHPVMFWSNTNSFADKTQNPTTSYFYKVWAYNKSGYSPSSPFVSAVSSAECAQLTADCSVTSINLSSAETKAGYTTKLQWVANPTGGTGTYSYNWGGAASGGTKTVTKAYKSNDAQTATIAVTSNAVTVTNSCTYTPDDCPAGQVKYSDGQCVDQNQCAEDVWSCSAWDTSSCSVDGTESRTCTKTFDCPNADTPSPSTSQYCSTTSNNTSGNNNAVGDAQFTISPSIVSPGGHCTISWNASGAANCTLVGEGVSESSISGSVQTPALSETKIYTLTCTDGTQTIAKSGMCKVFNEREI